jgi:transposase
METGYMSLSSEETIQLLLKTNKEQEETIQDLRTTVKELRATIVNLNETLEELKRKLFGASSERTCAQSDINTGSEDQLPSNVTTEETETTVKEHTRKRKKKSVRADLYEALPVKEIPCDVPEAERFCPDCDSVMEHLGYKFVREELRITPAKVVRVRYMQETLVCPVCRQEDETTIKAAKAPTPLLVHSPASPDMVAMIMYQKSFLHLPFYRQSKDWIQKGVPVPRETAAHWYNYCALEYLSPIYESLHQELLAREVIHADEVPCQVLHEQGRAAASRSYLWIYLSGTDGKPPVILYDYRPGRSGDYPIEFLSGFTGMLHCDGYSAYGRIEDVILVCCLAHCRRKFYEAVPKERRKKLKLLDINSEQEIDKPKDGTAADPTLLPAEKGVAFCNRLFYLERFYKELPAEERKQKRQEKEPAIWNEFWSWLDTLSPTGGSKLEKAVNYALNHRETLMNYLLDGRCEISNNAAERRAKSYVTGRKNFLFHDTEDGAAASAVVLSLIETAKANNLNIYQYLYTLLLYIPDYKEEPAGIEQLMPWSEFIKESCSGITDTEKTTPENRGNLPI